MNTRLTGISSMATRQVLADVAAGWRHSGSDVAFESVGGVEAAKRVQDGETFDVVVLAAEAIDKLIAAGRVVASSRTHLARSGVGIAVRVGAPRPATDTEAALSGAVLSARTIGYSTGPSGVALQQLFERWGIAEAIRPRLAQAPPGVPVGAPIARGDVAYTAAKGGSATPQVQQALSATVPLPPRPGQVEEFAELVLHIVHNRYLNGEVIRLDGAARMAAR